jgi:hypothetical protein
MNGNWFRAAAIVGLAVMFIGAAYLASGGQLFWDGQERPTPWPTFAVPDGGFTVRFPTDAPAEADLALNLIDSGLPDFQARETVIRNVLAAGGRFRGWSAEQGATRYMVRVLHMPPTELAVGAALRMELVSQKSFAPFLTNMTVVEKQKTFHLCSSSQPASGSIPRRKVSSFCPATRS